jgi:anti-sigma factor RsiW
MNHETELKLQAYLDNELSAEETQQITTLLERDDKARAIVEELRNTRSLLADNELDRALPESREFFWTKIEREIARQDAASEPEKADILGAWWKRLVRVGAPVAGTAFLMAILFSSLTGNVATNQKRAAYFHEIESSDEQGSAMTFHSESAKMTVVWIGK